MRDWRAEAEEVFRVARARAATSSAARDLAGALALVRLGLTSVQIRSVWVRVEPAMMAAVAHMRSVIARAREILRSEAKPRTPRPPSPRV